MNERIDEIDDLEASGILENHPNEEKENEENSNRSVEDLKTIEELKRSKVVEAVQASTVYNNLSEIPGLNTREFLNSIVDMYMVLDAKTPGNPEYIDFESLNIIINSVKEHEIDLVQNGIVTNDDGTINKIESAEQIHDMTGIPVSQILAQNKYDNSFEISNVRYNASSQQKMFEVILGNCDGDTKEANIIYNNYMKQQRAKEKFLDENKELKLTEKDKTPRVKGKKFKIAGKEVEVTSVVNSAAFKQLKGKKLTYLGTHTYKYMETLEDVDIIQLGYDYNIFDKDIPDEKKQEYLQDLKEIQEKHPNNKFINKMLDKNGNINFAKAVAFAKIFEKNYNNEKNKVDLEEYLKEDSIELFKMDTPKKRQFLLDIYIGSTSKDEYTKKLAQDLLSRTKSQGVELFSKDWGDLTPEMVLNIYNSEFTTDYKADSPNFKRLIEMRKLNSLTAEGKFDKIRYSIENQGKNDIEFSSSNEKKAFSKVSDRVEILKSQIKELGMGNARREKEIEIANVLDKLEFKGTDCANALTVKLLYAKLCERDYALSHGKYPETKEEKAYAYKNLVAHTDANALSQYMKRNPAIFGDFIADVQNMDIKEVEKMLEQNRLKSSKENISIDKLMKEVEYAGIKGGEKDLEVNEKVVDFRMKLALLRKYEKMAGKRNISSEEKAEAKENFEKYKEEFKKTLRELPTAYKTSALVLRILEGNLNKRTQEEIFKVIKDSIIEEKEKVQEEEKETLISKIKKWRDIRKISKDREQKLQDILDGKRDVMKASEVSRISLEDKTKISEARAAKMDREFRKAMQPEKYGKIDDKPSKTSKEKAQENKSKEETSLTKPKENRILKFLQDTFDLAGKAGEQIVNGSQKAAENIGNFVNNIGKVQKNKAIKDAKDKLPKEDAEKVEKMYKEPEDKSKEWIVSKEVLEENKAKAKKDKQQEKERQEQKDRQKSEQKTVPTGPENAGGR